VNHEAHFIQLFLDVNGDGLQDAISFAEPETIRAIRRLPAPSCP
jgi:hypothetical protein